MNRTETKELLPVMQAYAEGKPIQYRAIDGGYWYDVSEDKDVEWDRYEFRVKPEPKYRPFKDAEECWNEMLKHQPFGWIKDENTYYHIACVFDADKEGDSVTIETVGYKSFNGVLACYTFADGTPFGIKEGGDE